MLHRLILQSVGMFAIEPGARLPLAEQISLGRNVYLDHGVYLHACPQGISIGDDTFAMHGAESHVYNLRDLPHGFIRIGRKSLIGEYNVQHRQGGIAIGDRVCFGPPVLVLAVNHVFSDPTQPMVEQGITVEDDAWVGAGAIITDDVRIGQGVVAAAGSVVTQDVPPHTVVGGVPARVLKRITTDVTLHPANRQVFL